MIGVLGAGKLGTVIARLAVAAGYPTMIAASGDPEDIRLVIDVLSPGAVAAWMGDVIQQSDIVVLAIPLSRLHTVPAPALRGKVVLDATNYWPPTDGVIEEFEHAASSPKVAAALPGARVVKALSHLGYHELDSDGRPHDAPDRRAIAIAGDDPRAVAQAVDLVDQFGFDPVVVPGGLEAGVAFGPGTAAFGASVNAEELRAAIGLKEAQ